MPSLKNLFLKIQSEMFFDFLRQLRDLWRKSEFPEGDSLEVKINLQVTHLVKNGKRGAKAALQFKSLLK